MKPSPKQLNYRYFLERDEIASKASAFLKLIFTNILLFLGINTIFVFLGVLLGKVIFFLQISLLLSLFLCPIVTIFIMIKKEKKQK